MGDPQSIKLQVADYEKLIHESQWSLAIYSNITQISVHA